jgi:predicted RNase H-like HicB family nuclease
MQMMLPRDRVLTPFARGLHPKPRLCSPHADGGGWGAYIPDLPGVVALGATRADVTKRIQEALNAFADDVRERGGSMPAPHHAAGTVAT